MNLVLISLTMVLSFLLQYLGLAVILGSTHPDRYGILDFLVEKHNHSQDRVWEVHNKKHVALDDSIPVAINYRKHIYFMFS